MKSTMKYSLLALAGLAWTSAAHAGLITASEVATGGQSASAGGATFSAYANTEATIASTLASKHIPGIGTGLGVNGYGNTEIDWYATPHGGNSELLRVTLADASYVHDLTLGLLFDGPEYGDYLERANFRVRFADGSSGQYTLAALFGGGYNTALWGGGGNWVSSGLWNGGAGLWVNSDPFAGRAVRSFDMFAPPGSCGVSSGCWDQSDFVFRSMRTTSVPEPGTLALFAVALAGLALARRRRSQPVRAAA